MMIEGKTAVVSGGASGLGEACVRHLLRAGARVAVFDFAAERGKQLSQELGEKVVFVQTDVTDEAGVQTGINRTLDAFGAIHMVINCAGGGTPRRVYSSKGPCSLQDFNKIVQINLIGTFNIIRLAVEHMIKNSPNEDGEKGVIVNAASIAAFDGQIGQAAYSAAKAGVVGMTLPLARECAEYGIRVMTIAPGIFDTPILAQLSENVRRSIEKSVPFPQRMGSSDEFAMLVRHIIENSYLNGEVIRLDGAMRVPAK
jgi:3-hydroxyacyl-CoA dehydrogenase/3-hydroxy-2-methylbutyryl-CoA dehydrogenase